MPNPIRPSFSDSGSPVSLPGPVRRVHVAPPSVVFQMPLPAPAPSMWPPPQRSRCQPAA